FASVIGETNPIYTDVEAATAAGYPDLVLPPTFLFSLELERPDREAPIRLLGVDQRQILHGEQEFAYHNLAFAGQRLSFAFRLVDYYEKKGGSLKFLTRQTDVTRDGEAIATLSNVMIVRE